ncbi:MAG: alpha/beta hydrolase [Actinomycetia bacterium]|nr:alpha/beta hydrolase [Actinomycetes bacterium]
MRRLTPLLLVVTALLATACTNRAPAPLGTERYAEEVFASTRTTYDVVYASAPDLVSGQPVDLVLDWTEPVLDTLAERPVIVWIHGGGFKGGDKSSLSPLAAAWAKRGYVTLSINYRVDPGNRCQELQDGEITDPTELEQETARCTAAIIAAQHDAQAAIRWVRANALLLRADPTRVAVGGTSAGAVTAVNVAQRSDDPGTVGTDLAFDSSVAAALAASGCQYLPEDIDSSDAPVHHLASEFDAAVPFECTMQTEALALAAGVDAGSAYYYGEGTHALGLYNKYRSEVDPLWSAFLIQHLGL